MDYKSRVGYDVQTYILINYEDRANFKSTGSIKCFNYAQNMLCTVTGKKTHWKKAHRKEAHRKKVHMYISAWEKSALAKDCTWINPH